MGDTLRERIAVLIMAAYDTPKRGKVPVRSYALADAILALFEQEPEWWAVKHNGKWSVMPQSSVGEAEDCAILAEDLGSADPATREIVPLYALPPKPTDESDE